MMGEPVSPSMFSIRSMDKPVVQDVSGAFNWMALRKQLARHHRDKNIGKEKVCLHVPPALRYVKVDARCIGCILPARQPAYANRNVCLMGTEVDGVQ